MAPLIELKQRYGISVGVGGGFATPASVTPVIAAQGGGMRRSGRLLAAVISCGLQEKFPESAGNEAQGCIEMDQQEHVKDLQACDVASHEGRKRMQRILSRMLNTQVRATNHRNVSCYHYCHFDHCRGFTIVTADQVSAASNGASSPTRF